MSNLPTVTVSPVQATGIPEHPAMCTLTVTWPDGRAYRHDMVIGALNSGDANQVAFKLVPMSDDEWHTWSEPANADG